MGVRIPLRVPFERKGATAVDSVLPSKSCGNVSRLGSSGLDRCSQMGYNGGGAGGGAGSFIDALAPVRQEDGMHRCAFDATTAGVGRAGRVTWAMSMHLW